MMKSVPVLKLIELMFACILHRCRYLASLVQGHFCWQYVYCFSYITSSESKVKAVTGEQISRYCCLYHLPECYQSYLGQLSAVTRRRCLLMIYNYHQLQLVLLYWYLLLLGSLWNILPPHNPVRYI